VERIIYISTCRTDPDRLMVEDILRQSRRNNRRDGLTGLLVVGGRRFLQVLDGDDLSELVGQLTAKVGDADLRVQFQSFAALHSRAA
jgi:hypothetical protein